MEETRLNPSSPQNQPASSEPSEFAVGSEVVYALHGKGHIRSIEDRATTPGAAQRFYKVEVQKSALSRSKKPDPAIWIPVDQALERGLRAPMSLETANSAIETLQSKEYFFSIDSAWSEVYPQLESCIRAEGGVGLAKVYSYLFVLMKKQLVPNPEVAKFFDGIQRQLMKELSEALHEAPRSIESRIAKGLRSKTLDQ